MDLKRSAVRKVGGTPDHLLRRVATAGAWIELHILQARVADLVWEANTGVGG